MLKYELATFTDAKYRKILLLLFEWTSRSLVSQRWFFIYSKVRIEGNSVIFITGKSFQDQRTRVFVSRFSNDNEEVQ